MEQEYIDLRTYDIIKKLLKTNDVVSDDIHVAWEENSISSFLYIQIIVALEKEFSIEFDDKYLAVGIFKTIKEVNEYIEERLKVSQR